MRLFIAVPLPENIGNALQTLQEQYNTAGVRAVPLPNLHLTLYFLGEPPTTALPALRQKLAQIAATHHSFNLTLEEIAPGPKLKLPRLIWARFQNHPAFVTLSQSIFTALVANAKPPADFIPHVTIARLQKDKPARHHLPILRDLDFPGFPVQSFAIWQSELASPHPRYSVLENFKLLQADL